MKNLKKILIAWLLSNFNVSKIDHFISGTPVINIFYKLFKQSTIDYDFPSHIFIESTRVCNLLCKMCPRTDANDQGKEIDFTLYKKVVDEANLYGPRSFCLHLFGEPLLARKIDDMIKYIKDVNPHNRILLTTNGTVLTRAKAEMLIDNKVDKVAISFTSPDRETYIKKVGVDSLYKVEENIERLLKIKEEKKAKKPLIFLRMIVAKDTESQAQDFIDRWKDKKAIVELRSMHNYGGNIKETNVKSKKKRYPCYHLWLSPAIHWNGEVTICCDDYTRETVLGNIKDKTMHEMWVGAKLAHYRKLHMEGKYDKMPVCGGCDVWNMYSDLFLGIQKG